MNILRRLFRALCKPDDCADPAAPVRPRVTPDAERAAELQRRRDALTTVPKHDGFMPNTPAPKPRASATVTQIRRRG